MGDSDLSFARQDMSDMPTLLPRSRHRSRNGARQSRGFDPTVGRLRYRSAPKLRLLPDYPVVRKESCFRSTLYDVVYKQLDQVRNPYSQSLVRLPLLAPPQEPA
jgi:hypothetical protein